jgi:hypothetical protein
MQNPTPDTPGFAGFAAEKAQNIGSRERVLLVEYNKPYLVPQLT